MSDAELMIRDVFPAEIALSDGSIITRARVFLTNQRFIVWREADSRNVEKVLELSVDEHDTIASRSTFMAGERFTVRSGSLAAIVNKGSGCGCGSPLKALATPVTWNRSTT